MSEYRNVMIDLETLGVTPNAAVLCIAAVKFNFGDDDTEVLKVNISQKSCQSYGLITDKETVDWWVKDKPDLLKSYFYNSIPLEKALTQLADFLGEDSKKYKVWSNGTVFDISILEWDYRVTGIPCPWRYHQIHDARTIYSTLLGSNFRDYPRVGEYHNAVDDCLTQIKALKEIFCD